MDKKTLTGKKKNDMVSDVFATEKGDRPLYGVPSLLPVFTDNCKFVFPYTSPR